MKKMLIVLLAVIGLFTLTACGKDNANNTSGNGNVKPQEGKKEEQKNEQKDVNDDVYIDDDEIIEWDDTDNVPIDNGPVVVEEVINCPGCVYAYFSDEGEKAKTLGSTLSSSEYTTDINNLKKAGGKQRYNFFGLVLSGNTISKAYSCIFKDNKIYCIQGSTNGAYFTSNVSILNKIFKSGECKYLSNGYTYWCENTKYSGDTQKSGYTALHYDTSCTIYGSDAQTGRLICH